MKKTIKLDEATALTLYKTASPELKIILEESFGKEFLAPKKITERIKDINDIFKIYGKSREEIVPYLSPINKFQISQNALALIQVITEVYNEGTVMDFDDKSQRKYYLWFEKKAHGWVVYCVYSRYDGVLGFGCYFKSEELAKDAGKKFLSIFNEYLP